MKAYKVEIFVIDHDNLGEHEIKRNIENVRYPNHCMSPAVKSIQGVDIGAWRDDHPLNKHATADDEYARLFPV